MDELEKAARELLCFCAVEWVRLWGEVRPLDSPEQLGDMPAYFVPSGLIVALAVAHDKWVMGGDPADAQKNGPAFPPDGINLDNLPLDEGPG